MSLLEATKALMKLIDDGKLARDISHDHEPGWALNQVELVLVLARAHKAIIAAEKENAVQP